MKINGVPLYRPFEVEVFIPRDKKEDHIMFIARACDFIEEFAAVAEEPIPPMRTKIGDDGPPTPVLDDPDYVAASKKHEAQRMDFIVLKSLEPTEWLEWDKVKLDNPETFHLFREEMKEAGLSVGEVGRIIGECMRVNGLSSGAIEQAKIDFLALKAQKKDKSQATQDGEADSTSSTEPAKDSE